MMEDMKRTLTPQGDDTDFYRLVADLLAAARKHAKRQMDSLSLPAGQAVSGQGGEAE